MSSIEQLRSLLKNSKISIGTWMQIPSPEIAEIFSATNYYEWIVVDMEHGSFSRSQLPSIVRAISKNSMPFVRLQSKNLSSVKDVVDCGFSGYIVPMIENKKQLEIIFQAINYPPVGTRGVGFSRSNQYGINFEKVTDKNSKPFLVAMIETAPALENLNEILNYENLDAVIIGPYDLSASLGVCGDFESEIFKNAIAKVKNKSYELNIPFGMHLIDPCNLKLQELESDGAQFIAYSMDSVMLSYLKPSLGRGS